MNNIWDFDQCVLLFNRQISLLKRMCHIQDSVRKAVVAREWADFNWKTAELNLLGEEFNNLEAERILLIDALKEKFGNYIKIDDFTPSFYTIITILPQEQSRELSSLFRELKMETLRLKSQNEIFSSYLNEIKTVASACMEAMFPVQGGKLYTREGQEAGSGQRSVVLSQHI